jgi:hypothetical protein
MQSNQLFFVRADNGDGENLDLLVVAEDKMQAETLWRTHYDVDASPEWVGTVPGVAPTSETGAIDWASIRG